MFQKIKNKKLKVVVKVGLLHLLKPRSHMHHNIILLLQFLLSSSTQSSSIIFHSHFVKSSQFFQILFINWYMFWCQNGRPLNLKWAKALIVAPIWCFGHKLLVLNRKVGDRFLVLDTFSLISLDYHHRHPLFLVYWTDCGCGFRRLWYFVC